MKDQLPCRYCGSINIPKIARHLWDLHWRRKSGRQHDEALVFDSHWLQENILDEDDEAALDLAMSRDMANRGLCPQCGLPDLRGLTSEDFYTEEEAQELADMYAEQAAERRAGC